MNGRQGGWNKRELAGVTRLAIGEPVREGREVESSSRACGSLVSRAIDQGRPAEN